MLKSGGGHGNKRLQIFKKEIENREEDGWLADEDCQVQISGIYRWSSDSSEADTGMQIQLWKSKKIGIISEVGTKSKNRSLLGLIREI